VEGEKFNLGQKFRRKSSGEKFKFALGLHLCCWFCCEIGQHFAAVSTPNIAELVPSHFSVHNHGICGVQTNFARKTQHFHVDRQLVTEKEISSKIISNEKYC